jgi:hypothetical protein
MRALGDLSKTGVAIETGSVRRTGESMELTATVHNHGDTVAAMLRLSLRDRHSGDRVLPTRYSDNYMWLLPGETRRIVVSWQSNALPSGTPQVIVDGYNVSTAKS